MKKVVFVLFVLIAPTTDQVSENFCEEGDEI